MSSLGWEQMKPLILYIYIFFFPPPQKPFLWKGTMHQKRGASGLSQAKFVRWLQASQWIVLRERKDVLFFYCLTLQSLSLGTCWDCFETIMSAKPVVLVLITVNVYLLIATISVHLAKPVGCLPWGFLGLLAVLGLLKIRITFSFLHSWFECLLTEQS